MTGLVERLRSKDDAYVCANTTLNDLRELFRQAADRIEQLEKRLAVLQEDFNDQHMYLHGRETKDQVRIKELEGVLTNIAEGNCPGSLINIAENATSQAEAQRLFHMAFSEWMQKIARAALKGAQV